RQRLPAGETAEKLSVILAMRANASSVILALEARTHTFEGRWILASRARMTRVWETRPKRCRPFTPPSVLHIIRPIDAVALQLVIKRLAGNAERRNCLRHIPIRLFQRFANDPRLDRIHAFGQGARCGHGSLRN